LYLLEAYLKDTKYILDRGDQT